jgi:2-aminobenzoate-CoA ligase
LVRFYYKVLSSLIADKRFSNDGKFAPPRIVGIALPPDLTAALAPNDLRPLHCERVNYHFLNLAHVLVSDHVARGHGRATAVVADDGVLDYQALQARVDGVSQKLLASRVHPGDRVLIRLPNSLALVVLWLGVQRIGAIAIATPVAFRAREIADIVRDATPVLCVVGADDMAQIEQAGRSVELPPVLLPSDFVTTAEPKRDALDPTAEEVPAIIAYTAGIDGIAKGACHFASQMIAAIDTYGQVLRLSSSDVVGGSIPIAFTYGLGALLILPLRFGATVVLLSAFDAERLLATIEKRHVTVLFGTATTYRILLRLSDFERRFELRSLRLCVSAGEPLEREVAVEWMRRTGIDLIDSFGTTEMFHTFLSSGPGSVIPGSVGTPVPGYEVRVVDEHLRDVPDNIPGLLAVRGLTGCIYWRRPEAQRAYVRDGWNLTGDVMLRDGEGRYWFQQRADAIIVSAGYNISPIEVERVLESHPSVREAAALGIPDPIRHRVPAAAVVLRSPAVDQAATIAALHLHAGREMAGFKCPRHYEFVDALPKLSNGALDRHALRERYARAAR